MTLKFADQSGKPVDVGRFAEFSHAGDGTMAVMNNAATLTTTGTQDLFSSVDLEMSGEWRLDRVSSPAGNGRQTYRDRSVAGITGYDLANRLVDQESRHCDRNLY